MAAKLETHAYSLLFPTMENDQFQRLQADIKVNGQFEPIHLYKGKILDGAHRYRACVALKKKPKTVVFKGNDEKALAFVISRNLMRRHLSTSQRGMIATEVANMKHGGDRYTGKKQGANSPLGSKQSANGKNQGPNSALGSIEAEAKKSIKDAAKQLNVSVSTVKTANAVSKKGSKAVIEAVKKGDISLHKAEEIVKDTPKGEQAAAVAEAIAPKPKPKIEKPKPDETHGAVYADLNEKGVSVNLIFNNAPKRGHFGFVRMTFQDFLDRRTDFEEQMGQLQSFHLIKSKRKGDNESAYHDNAFDVIAIFGPDEPNDKLFVKPYPCVVIEEQAGMMIKALAKSKGKGNNEAICIGVDIDGWRRVGK
jgi:ParB-like nuclease domain